MIKVEEIKMSDPSKVSRYMEPTTKITINEKWSLYTTVWNDEDKSLTISVVKDGKIISSSTY